VAFDSFYTSGLKNMTNYDHLGSKGNILFVKIQLRLFYPFFSQEAADDRLFFKIFCRFNTKVLIKLNIYIWFIDLSQRQ